MASPELDKAINMFRSAKEETKTLSDVEQFRAWYEGFTSEFPVDDDIVCERVGAGGVPAEWIYAPNAAEDRVLIYLHGGGYIIGSMRTHREPLSRLSRASGARVLGLDYRLAPENPFPAAVQDSVAAYRWLLDRGVEPKKIAIGGDSAGGGLTMATLVALRYMGEPLPAAGISHSGWTDLANSGETMVTKAEEDPLIDKEMLENMAMTYLGDKDRTAPFASPYYADLRGLPPLLVQVGSAEVLLDDSLRFAENAKAAGVDVTLEVWDDMPHVWQVFASFLPEGQQAIEHCGEFVRKHMP
jgi:monoterpene epsilon-lactone hydrolase